MTRLVFLHIPKTAGQSVHAGLEIAFGTHNVCPIRMNWQLYTVPNLCLDEYLVFSGHIDWAMLDFVPAPKLVFTVLRDPLERISSFYLYLRESALRMSHEELQKPEHQAERFATEVDINEYFSEEGPYFDFIQDHYDNFYTYFFAGRRYDSRRLINDQVRAGRLTGDVVLRNAISNARHIDFIASLSSLQKLEIKLSSRLGRTVHFSTVKENVNVEYKNRTRFEALKELGLNDETRRRLKSWTEMDYALIENLKRDNLLI